LRHHTRTILLNSFAPRLVSRINTYLDSSPYTFQVGAYAAPKTELQSFTVFKGGEKKYKGKFSIIITLPLNLRQREEPAEETDLPCLLDFSHHLQSAPYLGWFG
jgi:hypothetical protein